MSLQGEAAPQHVASREELEAEAATFAETVHQVLLTDIRPDPTQVRRDWDSEDAVADIEALAQEFTEMGQIHPITLRLIPPAPGEQLGVQLEKYEIVAGERRWRAAMRAGWKSIQAKIKTFDSESARITFQLAENLGRRDLNLWETCQGVERLVRVIDSELIEAGRQGESALDIASKRLGTAKLRDRAWLSRRANLSRLRTEVQDLVRDGVVRDIEVAHLAHSLGDLDPEQYLTVVQDLREPENALNGPVTKEWLRDEVRDLKRKAEQQEGGEKPATTKPVTASLELKQPAAVTEAPGLNAIPAQRCYTEGGDGAPRPFEQVNGTMDKAVPPSTDARKAKVRKLAADIEAFAAEQCKAACLLFDLPYDPAQPFGALSVNTRNQVQEFSPTLPTGADTNDYQVGLRGTLGQLEEPLKALDPGAKIRGQLELTVDEALAVERALGRKLDIEHYFVTKGHELQERIEAWQGRRVSPRKAAEKRKADEAEGKYVGFEEVKAGVQRFLKERTRKVEDAMVKSSEAFGAYSRWAVKAKVTATSSTNVFGDALADLGVEKKRTKIGVHYLGLELKG